MARSITKAELLESVSQQAGVSRAQAEAVLGAFFGQATTAAKAGDKVGWPGFGSFSASKRAARMGRNPQSGAPVKIAASTGMRFSASSVLKTSLNTKGAAKKAAPAKKVAPAKKAAAKKAAPAKKAAAKKR